MIDWKEIIDRHYAGNEALHHILCVHSRSVAQKALQIAAKHPELGLDTQFLEEAAMLHDIGIIKTDAPGIECFGTEPYIRHGLLGGEMLRSEGLPRHARVCERHTGAGLSEKEIVAQNLPLPHEDFLPETLEEQVVCYADKFFSKSHLDIEKPLAKVEKSIAKFGDEGLQRFKRWQKMFE